jgi:drug/metabolite transporter (DMT)-like permease
VLLSNLLLNYPIKPQVLIGGALIIGGVLLSMQRSANQPAPQQQAAEG